MPTIISRIFQVAKDGDQSGLHTNSSGDKAKGRIGLENVRAKISKTNEERAKEIAERNKYEAERDKFLEDSGFDVETIRVCIVKESGMTPNS